MNTTLPGGPGEDQLLASLRTLAGLLLASGRHDLQEVGAQVLKCKRLASELQADEALLVRDRLAEVLIDLSTTLEALQRTVRLAPAPSAITANTANETLTYASAAPQSPVAAAYGRYGSPDTEPAIPGPALNEHAIVSVADVHGRIIYVNELFCRISGYRREELLGNNHRLLKSGRHPAKFYEDMWRCIHAGQSWHGVICNRRRDGSYYWVMSSITPVLDGQGRPAEYVSIRTDITALKEAEERLRLYERIFMASTSGIAIADACRDGMPLLVASPSLITMTGYRADEILGSPSRCLHSEDNEPEELERVRGALHKGRPVQTLVRNLRKNGEPYFAELRYSPVHDEAGVLTHYVAVVDDVSELQQAQSRLIESGERMRLSQRYTNTGTWEWNPALGLITGSERLGPLFGLPPLQGPVQHSLLTEQVEHEDMALLRVAAQASLRGEGPMESEFRCRWPDGSQHWLLARGETLRAQADQPPVMVGIVQDVTRRKTAELQLALSQSRLMEAQRLARLGQWELSLRSGEMYWCERIYKLLDLDPATTPAHLDSLRTATHPVDRALLARWLHQAQQEGHAEITLRILLRDGGVLHLHQRARLINDAEGGQLLVGTSQDVSERMREQEELRAAKEAAERASDAKSTFLSGMSHELRTPMNAILGFAQLLEHESGIGEAQRNNVKEILSAGRHLLTLIDEVLDLARVEAGHAHLSHSVVALAPLVQECLSWLQPLAHAQALRFSTQVPAELCAWADHTRLKQVLVNLLSNAIKYNRPQGEVQVTARALPSGRLHIAVRDTGIGLTAQQRASLFQPFTRVHTEVLQAPGTGIGLSISKRLVEMMGGRIGVESLPQGGSEFWLELPSAEAALISGSAGAVATEQVRVAATTAPTTTPAAAPRPQRTRARVLCIEDHPANMRLLQEALLKQQHLELLCATDGAQGIDLALQHRPELILLDIHMPGMDGFEVLQILRADPLLRTIPVLAVSASAMPPELARAQNAGFAAFLSKPLDIALLLNHIERHLPTPS